MNFDNYTIDEIKDKIELGETTEEKVVRFYGNQWWDYETEVQ